MALFTDGNPATIEMLKAYESSILELAQRECIDLSVKLALAHQEVGEWLFAYLIEHAATDPQAALRRTLGLTSLVADSAIQRWLTVHALELIYRDAHHGQLNDRYKAIWAHYKDATETVRNVALRAGLGFVQTPVPRATRPNVTSTDGDWARGLYRIQTTWISVDGQSGFPSELVSFELGTDGGFSIAAPEPTTGVAGWNVYAGTADSELRLQNSQVITPGTAWISPEGGLRSDSEAPKNGQKAELFLRNPQQLIRG